MRRPPAKNNRWADHYTQRAKKDRYPARSVYKLQEIQRRYRLIGKGDKLLDLGCSPGSWLLYAADLVGENGQVVGLDLKAVSTRLPPNVQMLIGDIFDMNPELQTAMGQKFNGVMSDMAPATTGIKHVDSARSQNLCDAALFLARKILLPGGFFVCKVFQGSDFKAFTEEVRSGFHENRIFKPKSSRKASKEIYIIGKGRK